VINNDLVKLSNDTNICGGDTLMVSSSVGNASYKWNNGMSTRGIGIHSNGQYIVNVVDSDACVSADTIEVTVSKGAVLRADTSVCSGETIELDPGTPGGSYTWSRDGSTISTGTKIFADKAGTYKIEYIDAKSCSSIDSFELTVITIPSAKFTTTKSQNNIKFVADDKTGSNYFWSFGDGKSVNGPQWSTINNYAVSKTYRVTLTVSSLLCGDSTHTGDVDVLDVGVNELANSEQVTVFPNPSNGVINITIPDSFNSNTLNAEVVSADGKIVFVKSDLQSGSNYEFDLRSEVSTGVYFLRLKSDNNIIYSGKVSIN